MEYTVLSPDSRRTMIQDRRRELETQLFNLEMRLNAPDLQQPPTERDEANAKQLQDSIAWLDQQEQGLASTPS